MFQKHHMEAIATMMQDEKPGEPNRPNDVNVGALLQWKSTRNALSRMFKDSNPQFDAARFERACEPGANVKARTAGDISPELVRMAQAQWKREGKL